MINGSLQLVLDTYTDVVLDLPETDIKRLLSSGAITRAQMYRHWNGITPEMIERSDVALLTRVEMQGILQNPKISKLGLKYSEFKEVFSSYLMRNAYRDITIEEADRFDVKLNDVLDNVHVSTQVKRHLIQKAFEAGDLPVKTVEELKLYQTSHVTRELMHELYKINWDTPLVSEELFNRDSLARCRDLSSRVLLIACSKYDESLTVALLNADIQGLGAEEFYSLIKGPDSKSYTERLLKLVPPSRRLVQYVASQGKLNSKALFDKFYDMADLVGEMMDFVALYENNTINDKWRAKILEDFECTPLTINTYQRHMVDLLITTGGTKVIADFSAKFYKEPVFFQLIQKPSAFKLTGIYTIHHLTPWAGIVDDILTACHNLTFTDSEARVLMSELLISNESNDAMLFLMHDGISIEVKKDYLEKAKTLSAI